MSRGSAFGPSPRMLAHFPPPALWPQHSRFGESTSHWRTKMYIEPAILSAASALTGAFMGGGASLVAALYTQRCQNRLQRATREVTKRETVYADFIMNASKSLLNAYLNDEIRLDSEQQALIGIANRMRLFATE